MAEEIVDIEEAVLEKKDQATGLVPATHTALDLPACEVHNFEFLRTAKFKQKLKERSEEGVLIEFYRMDTFYCRQCLQYTTMERREKARFHPAWYRDDR